jgi:hypothetical protein
MLSLQREVGGVASFNNGKGLHETGLSTATWLLLNCHWSLVNVAQWNMLRIELLFSTESKSGFWSTFKNHGKTTVVGRRATELCGFTLRDQGYSWSNDPASLRKYTGRVLWE